MNFLENEKVSVFLRDSNFNIYKNKFFYEIIKRLLDIAVCIILFPISIILIFIASIAIKLESNGPIFYVQERLGKNGHGFKIYKLRSMVLDAEKDGVKWADKDDPRITKVGKFIRLTRIDEIPQLWNVIKGDMTIVGPRPEREFFYNKFESEGINYRRRLSITPGLTGLAQVNGGYDITPKEKLKWDMEYIKRRSLFMDFKIILKTVRIIFTGEGAR